MSPSPQLAPPGSSSYSSNTMFVGDGTWDSERNTFLLPNLVGLNFATMRYNGMANRFFTLTGYHALIRAHGILAAVTFLGLVPAAIMLARFYKGRSWALRLHVWFQVVTFLLTTVLFILGFFAVGPERSLSNPHHGIGVAIYVLIILQVFGGWFVHRKDKGKRRLPVPLKLMLHHWFGRTIAILGLVQVPLGLTLYGSPQFLFVLYALAAFVLLVTYFILSWKRQRWSIHDYETEGSYHSGHDEVIDDRRDKRKSGIGKLAAAGLGAAGLAALWRRRSSRNRRDGDDDVVGTDSGTSYISNEKHSDTRGKGWQSKLLTLGATIGAIAAVKALFGKKRDDFSETGSYRPPHGGNQSETTDSYLEEGRPHRPVTPTGASPGYIRPSHPLAQPPMTPHHRHSNSSLSYSYASGSPSRRDRRTNFRDAVATGGALYALRGLFKSRRQRKEDRRLEEERMHRAGSQNQYTGDGSPPKHRRPNAVASQIGTDLSGSVMDDRHHRPGGNATGPILGGVGAASAAALADRNRIRPPGTDPPVISGPSNIAADVPPLPPTHGSEVDSSGTEAYTTHSGHPHRQNHRRDEAASGLAAGTALGAAASGSRRRRSSRTQNTDSMESPPVSLKVKMHNDGRHVTLRRLTEEEAAAQREERKRAKRASHPAATGAAAGAGIANSSRRRRNSSFSSSSGGDAGTASGRLSNAERRWRRTEALERQQAEQAAAMQNAAALGPPPLQPPQQPQYQQQPQQHPMGGAPYYPQSAALAPPPPPPMYPVAATAPPPMNMNMNMSIPPPPPIPQGPGSHLGFDPGSVTSPGTETSGATEYANNRKRRRAERAQARLAREAGGGRMGTGQGVEFS